MMGKYFRTLPLLVFLVTVTAWKSQAQTLTESGWVVVTPGDTLKGNISIERGQGSPSKITLDRNGVVQTYTPKEVAFFQMGETRYQSLSVDIDQSPRSLRDLEAEERPTGTLPADIFATQIVTGKMNLLRWNDERSNSRFFILKDGKAMELTYRVTRLEVNGTSRLSTTRVYVGQLNTLMADCQPALQRVEKR